MQLQYVSFTTCPTQNHSLGSLMTRRRHKMQMACAEASELSGVPYATWAAMEAGWAPALDETTLFAVAGTLKLSIDLVFDAASRYE